MAGSKAPPSNLYVNISSLATMSVTRSRVLFIAPVHAIWLRRLSSSVTPSFAAYCRTSWEYISSAHRFVSIRCASSVPDICIPARIARLNSWRYWNLRYPHTSMASISISGAFCHSSIKCVFLLDNADCGSANASAMEFVIFNGVTDFAKRSHIVDFPQNFGPETTTYIRSFERKKSMIWKILIRNFGILFW